MDFPYSLFLKQVVLAISFILCFFSWGRIFFNKLKLTNITFFEAIFFYCVVGISIIVLLNSALSITGIAYKEIPIIFLLCGLLGLKGLKVGIKDLKWFFILFSISLPTLILTLYPPTKWDDISYHLPIAWTILENHKLVFNKYIRYPVFPVNGEMLLYLGLIFNAITAQLMSWICLFLLAIGCFSTVARKYSNTGGIIAFCLLISNQLLISIGTIAYIDIILAMFITAGIISFINYLDNDNKTWLYVCALMMGTAAGIKYTALVFLLLIGLILMGLRKWRILVSYTVLTGLIGGIWYIRNFYYTGNPVWPFMSSIFGFSEIWQLSDYEGQFADFDTNGIKKSILNFIKIPFYLNQPTEGGVIGLNLFIWIGLLVGVMITKKSKQEYKLIILWLTYTIFWFLTVNLPRYYIPAIPIACIISAIGFAYLLTKVVDIKLIRYIILSILLVLSLSYPYTYISKCFTINGKPPSNSEQIEQYLINRLPTYKATKIASSLPGKTYGLLNENMYYYGEGKVVGDWFGETRYSKILNLLDQADSLYLELKNMNMQNLLINKSRLNAQILAKVRLSSQFKKVYEDDYAILYKLN